MRYADQLRETFAGLDPQLDDLFLLERHQIATLPDRAPRRELAVVLHADPRIRRFLLTREPSLEPFVASLLAEHGAVADDELAASVDELLWELADLIVYQRDPARYDEGSEFDPSLVTDVVDLVGKDVVDAGAGTGRVAFAVAPHARSVFAVEPSASLRRYMRDRTAELGASNVFVVDGFLHDLPLPSSSVDVVLTRQAIGWQLPDELAEIERVVRRGGAALHLVGPPSPETDELDAALVTAGYEAGSYREGGVDKRRYLLQVGSFGG